MQGFGSFIWLIVGAVYRWGFVGKVCSGDYVVEGNKYTPPYAAESGQFMKYFLLITFSIIGLGICYGVIVGIYLGVNAVRA